MTPVSALFNMFSSSAVILICLPLSVLSTTFPNEIVDQPSVTCSQGEFSINVETTNGVPAKIFAKGFADEDDCAFGNVNLATFSLSACNINRKRQIEPRGIQYNIVIIVQLHPLFITKVDRAYHVKCFYMEADKIVTAGLDVSQLTTVPITSSNVMPVCTYTLHTGTPDGPEAKYARVGDKVWHKWTCPGDGYGMLVHSCFVNDQQGKQIMILDEMGCGIDQYVMLTPEYNIAVNVVQQETHVFKLADRISVKFDCSIKLCLKDADGCAGVAPPNCSPNRNSRIIDAEASTSIVEETTLPTIAPTMLVEEETTVISTTVSAATPPSAQPDTVEPQLAVLENNLMTGEPFDVVPTSTTASSDLTTDQLLPIVDAVTDETIEKPTATVDDTIEGSGETVSIAPLINSEPYAQPVASQRYARREWNDFNRRLNDVPDDIVTDVNQELIVLDVDQSDTLADSLIDREPNLTQDWSLGARESTDETVVCVSSLGFGVIIAALTLILLCSILTIYLAYRRQPGTRQMLKFLESESSSMSASLSRATSRTDVMARI